LSRITLLFGSFTSGGVGRFLIRTATELLGRGYEVDMVVGRRTGDLLPEAPRSAKIIVLKRAPLWRARLDAIRADPPLLSSFVRLAVSSHHPSGKLRYLPSLTRYLAAEKPAAILAATAPFNMIAVWARTLAGSGASVIATEHNQLSAETVGNRKWRYDLPPDLMRRSYLQANAIVAPSEGVKQELHKHVEIPTDRITTIHYPVVDRELLQKAAEPLDHPWFAPGQPPVILGVGTLKPQKDFPTLIRAFARVRAVRPARLMILGDSRPLKGDFSYGSKLLKLPGDLGIDSEVRFEGFVANPFAYMRQAALFVLSSAWEGLGNVVVEALACGTPVVSTDCPSGPSEILDGGRYGRLVPVGDDAALAAAILETLGSAPPPRSILEHRGAEFSAARAIDRYLELMTGSATPLAPLR